MSMSLSELEPKEMLSLLTETKAISNTLQPQCFHAEVI